ncbi:glycosyltransferase family 39 protein [Candidatus Roizmanbacteria bacterium]|nr:glycosyltransferase family 39 protein [Candidatus Roizmanbacteria bacterium]
MLKKIFLTIVILLLLFVSLFPRSIEVLNGNPIFEIDQGRDYMAVKSIVVDRKLTLIGAELGAGQAGLQYLFHGPGYFYMLTIPFILFDGHPIGGVYVMLLFGLATIAFSMYFARRLFGITEALIMGFLVALCPFFIGQSRFIENHFPTPFLILLIFYAVYRFTKHTSDTISILFAAFLSAALYNFETAIAVPLCITLVVYCMFLYRKKIITRLPYIIGGFVLGFLPMLLFEIRHGFMGIKSLFTYLFLSHESHPASSTILVQAQNIVNQFIFSFSDSFAGRLVVPVSIVLPVFILLVTYVFYTEKKRNIKNFLTYILLLYPINFFVFLFLRNIVFQHYIIDLFLVNLFLSTYILSRLYAKKHIVLARTMLSYLVLLIVVGTHTAYTTSINDYGDYGGSHKLRGKIEAIDFIYQDADGTPFNVLVFYPPVYTYPYDYLFWWHGSKTYGYVPGNEKKGTFYLLMEKDSEKPWSYQGWQETVVKTGRVVFTETLPRSGIVVEKRIQE